MDCFSISTRCGVELAEECPHFETQAEEAVLNSLREGVAPIIPLVAPQGTGKSTLALRLYRRLLEEEGVLPVVLCGRRDLVARLDEYLVVGLNKALYEWVRRHRRVEKIPSSYGIENIRQLSYVLEVAGLKLFVILDEAHLVDDVGKFMEELRSLEELFAFAGVLLMFQDLAGLDIGQKLLDIFGRGGSRLKWDGDVLNASYLLPKGDVLEKVEAWARGRLSDPVAARVYRKLAETLGFRAANYFAQTFLKPPNKTPNLAQLHNALVKALARKYGAQSEVPVGRCRADLFKNGVAIDVKLCTDPQSLRAEVEKDKTAGCAFKYVVIGNCQGDVVLHTDISSIALGAEAAWTNMRVETFSLVAEAIAELIDLSAILGSPKATGPPLEKVAELVEQLCNEVGNGRTRSEAIKTRPAKLLAATLGLRLEKADDLNRLVQKLQQMGIGRIRLVGSRVQCIKASGHGV